MKTPASIFSALSALAILAIGCGLLREEPETAKSREVWRGSASWIDAEFTLDEEDDGFTGIGIVTQNPIEGAWESDGLKLELTTTSNANVSGTWSADWGSGTLTGIMSYPNLSMNLRLSGETQVVARIEGDFQEDVVTYVGSVRRDDRLTFLRLNLRDPLPFIEVDVSGEIRDGRIVLQLGVPFAFSGTRNGDVMAGVIVVQNAGFYRIDFRKTQAVLFASR